jgi:hypothetical protein
MFSAKLIVVVIEKNSKLTANKEHASLRNGVCATGALRGPRFPEARRAYLLRWLNW